MHTRGKKSGDSKPISLKMYFRHSFEALCYISYAIQKPKCMYNFYTLKMPSKVSEDNLFNHQVVISNNIKLNKRVVITQNHEQKLTQI